MILPVVTNTKEMNETKRSKKNIGVGSAVTEKVGWMEEKNRERRSMGTRKEVVGCVQSLMKKNKFLCRFQIY